MVRLEVEVLGDATFDPQGPAQRSRQERFSGQPPEEVVRAIESAEGRRQDLNDSELTPQRQPRADFQTDGIAEPVPTAHRDGEMPEVAEPQDRPVPAGLRGLREVFARSLHPPPRQPPVPERPNHADDVECGQRRPRYSTPPPNT